MAAKAVIRLRRHKKGTGYPVPMSSRRAHRGSRSIYDLNAGGRRVCASQARACAPRAAAKAHCGLAAHGSVSRPRDGAGARPWEERSCVRQPDFCRDRDAPSPERDAYGLAAAPCLVRRAAAPYRSAADAYSFLVVPSSYRGHRADAPCLDAADAFPAAPWSYRGADALYRARACGRALAAPRMAWADYDARLRTATGLHASVPAWDHAWAADRPLPVDARRWAPACRGNGCSGPRDYRHPPW